MSLRTNRSAALRSVRERTSSRPAPFSASASAWRRCWRNSAAALRKVDAQAEGQQAQATNERLSAWRRSRSASFHLTLAAPPCAPRNSAQNNRSSTTMHQTGIQRMERP